VMSAPGKGTKVHIRVPNRMTGTGKTAKKGTQ